MKHTKLPWPPGKLVLVSNPMGPPVADLHINVNKYFFCYIADDLQVGFRAASRPCSEGSDMSLTFWPPVPCRPGGTPQEHHGRGESFPDLFPQKEKGNGNLHDRISLSRELPSKEMSLCLKETLH